MFRPALVVTDDPEIADLACRALDRGVKNSNLWARPCDDAETALDLLDEVRATVAVVGGGTAEKAIHELVQHAPGLAIVAIADELEEVGALLAAGAHQFVLRSDLTDDAVGSETLITAARRALMVSSDDHFGPQQEVHDLVPLLAHHLREPIRSARVYNDRGRAPSTARWNDLVEAALSRADELSSSLLEYLRLDSAEVGPTRVIDLAEVERELLDGYHDRIESTGAEIDWRLRGAVRCQPASLRRILRILIDNAIDYSGPDTPTIDVRSTRVDDVIEIRVTDDGPGIPRQHVDAAFRPLERLDTSVDGIGIGLPLARRLAGLADGRLELEPRPSGTSMRLTLRAVD